MAYWTRVYSLQIAIKSAKQPDEKAFLIKIMDWLESVKKSQKDNESITNDTVAQAHLENYAYKLFSFADSRDRNSDFGKNVVKSFYTSAMLYDVMTVFGELSDEAQQNRKYAKWKAAYIHNCLKNGEQPHPGPLPSEEDDLLGLNQGNDNTEGSTGSSSMGWNTNPVGPATTQPPQQPPTQPPPVDHNPYDPFSNIRPPSPPKDPEEKHPGGFVAFDPSTSNIPTFEPTPQNSSTGLTPDQIMKAQKYCKYAGSALTFDDVNTAIENLQKALKLLTTGQD